MGERRGEGARRGSQAGADSSSPGSLMPWWETPHKAVSTEALGKSAEAWFPFLPPPVFMSGSCQSSADVPETWYTGASQAPVSCLKTMLMPLLVPSKTAPWMQNGEETLIKRKAVRTKDPVDFTGCRHRRAKTEWGQSLIYNRRSTASYI